MDATCSINTLSPKGVLFTQTHGVFLKMYPLGWFLWPFNSLEFMNFKLFGKSNLVVNIKFGYFFWAIHSASELKPSKILRREMSDQASRDNDRGPSLESGAESFALPAGTRSVHGFDCPSPKRRAWIHDPKKDKALSCPKKINKGKGHGPQGPILPPKELVGVMGLILIRVRRVGLKPGGFPLSRTQQLTHPDFVWRGLWGSKSLWGTRSSDFWVVAG